MGNQERLSELASWAQGSAGKDPLADDVLEALTQLRAANERAEELAGYVLNLRAELASTRVDAEKELEEERELCDAIAQQRQRLELQVTELEAKLAALLEPKE